MNIGIVVLTVFEPSETVTIRIRIRDKRVGEGDIEFDTIVETIIVCIIVEWVGEMYIVFIQIEQAIGIRILPLIVFIDQIVAIIVDTIQGLGHGRIDPRVRFVTILEPIPSISI